MRCADARKPELVRPAKSTPRTATFATPAASAAMRVTPLRKSHHRDPHTMAEQSTSTRAGRAAAISRRRVSLYNGHKGHWLRRDVTADQGRTRQSIALCRLSFPTLLVSTQKPESTGHHTSKATSVRSLASSLIPFAHHLVCESIFAFPHHAAISPSFPPTRTIVAKLTPLVSLTNRS